jgi:hypothetical protein
MATSYLTYENPTGRRCVGVLRVAVQSQSPERPLWEKGGDEGGELVGGCEAPMSSAIRAKTRSVAAVSAAVKVARPLPLPAPDNATL